MCSHGGSCPLCFINGFLSHSQGGRIPEILWSLLPFGLLPPRRKSNDLPNCGVLEESRGVSRPSVSSWLSLDSFFPTAAAL